MIISYGVLSIVRMIVNYNSGGFKIAASPCSDDSACMADYVGGKDRSNREEANK